MAGVTEKLLVIDDQIGVPESPEQREFLRAVHPAARTGPRIPDLSFSFHDGSGGIERVLERIRESWTSTSKQRWAAVLLDIRFGEEETFGLDLLHVMRSAPDLQDLPVIVLSGEKPFKSKAQAASKLRADGYMPKSDEIGTPLINHAALEEKLLLCGLIGDFRTPEQLQMTKSHLLRGRSLAHLRCLREARRISLPQLDALLTGESGVGKTELGAYIHYWSGRRGSYIHWMADEVNEELDGPVLFGVWEHAYTGSGGRRSGLLEQANDGTFFLDEIANLPQRMQQRFLKVRDKDAHGKRRFVRVGSPGGRDHEIESDFIFLAGTNADLEQDTFRRDLLWGLGQGLPCPSLNERREDVPAVFRALVEKELRNVGHPDRDIEIDDQVNEVLQAQDWSIGNFRQLAKVARIAVQKLHRGFSSIDVTMLPDWSRRPQGQEDRPVSITAISVPSYFPADNGAEPSGALVQQHMAYLRNRAELLSQALERTMRPGRSPEASVFNKAAALKWMMNSNAVDTTSADRLFAEILESILDPSYLWLKCAGKEEFDRLREWLLQQPLLLAMHKHLLEKQKKPFARQTSGQERSDG